MSDFQFASAYAKLDRADKHLGELRELLLAYMSQPDVVTGNLANGPTPQSFRIQGAGHEIQAVIGDIAQNLRSALDHVVWQLVLANGGTPKPGGGGTQFPILAEETRHGSLAVRTAPAESVPPPPRSSKRPSPIRPRQIATAAHRRSFITSPTPTSTANRRSSIG